ncbi:testicular acid phosphatase homolog [Argiope bruennichi]|uniref:testicular acid phosphatase homolog n=1 Tax=Argiope bruennichi TaxID=94029 RepID=UPI00249461D5|nr:testicular acid phosphatase homolog [Argiope bruennichi]
MFGKISLVCILVFLQRAFSEEDSKLLLVQTLFRHGDRAPAFSYPTDPNKADCWPEGLGKLTLIGKRQQYALGKFLRSMYEDFITTNPNEVLVNSSAAHRCLTSAEATVASFYAPKGEWKIEEGLNWQPIPVHYFPTYQDKFLSYKGTCPRVAVEVERQLNTGKVQELFQKYQAKFEAISNYTEVNVFYGINALLLHDTILVEKKKNLTIPEWADLYWDELEETSYAIFHSVTSSPLTLRLKVGPLLEDISLNMKKKISGQLPHLKVQMYSTHDVNIAAVLQALNFTNMPRPPYCATLLFELHEMPDALMAVRLLYLNSTDPLSDMEEPHILVLDDCSEFCPVENFTKRLEHLIPDNWEQECRMID